MSQIHILTLNRNGGVKIVHLQPKSKLHKSKPGLSWNELKFK